MFKFHNLISHEYSNLGILNYTTTLSAFRFGNNTSISHHFAHKEYFELLKAENQVIYYSGFKENLSRAKDLWGGNPQFLINNIPGWDKNSSLILNNFYEGRGPSLIENIPNKVILSIGELVGYLNNEVIIPDLFSILPHLARLIEVVLKLHYHSTYLQSDIFKYWELNPADLNKICNYLNIDYIQRLNSHLNSNSDESFVFDEYNIKFFLKDLGKKNYYK